jgi:hypothetical protein
MSSIGQRDKRKKKESEESSLVGDLYPQAVSHNTSIGFTTNKTNLTPKPATSSVCPIINDTENANTISSKNVYSNTLIRKYPNNKTS